MTDEENLDRAEKELAEGYHDYAQAIINLVSAKSARKCYIQSEIYARKQWYNEQRKQLKAAVKLEPENETYKTKLAELNGLKTQGKSKKQKTKKQMGNGLNEEDKAFLEVCCFMCTLCH
ncbi:MAG: hypothetical protein K2H30_04300 [Clostridia bacterium]|nr:hypothetical protein [Clostridia bacterium]